MTDVRGRGCRLRIFYLASEYAAEQETSQFREHAAFFEQGAGNISRGRTIVTACAI
jgi:hypothetical protein